MEVIYQRCAGLDVGKDEVVACVRVPDGARGRRQELRTFKTFSSGLEALGDWLTELTGSSALDGAVPYQKVKRVGHGFRNFTNYRLRLLLHCGVTWQTHRTARLRSRTRRLMA